MDTTNKKRCNWPKDDALYIEYHDTEWGVPVYNDDKMFKSICSTSTSLFLMCDFKLPIAKEGV